MLQDATNPTEELGNQRKRRRTNSPISGALVVQSRSTNSANHDNSEEWENQLRTAAYGEHSIPIGNQGSVQTVKVESGKHDTTGSHVPEPICFSNTAKGTLSVLQVEITKSKLGGYGNKNTTSSKEQTTINTGGKLVSPRSQSLASNPNSKRKKRDLKDDIKQKVVKIKYGSTDESRQIMALKIQEICSGTIVRSNDEIKKPKVSEPVMASKPTHPFFLGTSSRTKEPRAIHETATEGYATSRKYEGGQDMDNEPQKESFPKELPSNANAFKNLPIRKEISHSLGQLRPIRHTGPMDPIWPPKDMAHVRPLIHEITTSSAFNIRIPASYRRRKLKYAKVHVAEKDEILQPYLSLVSPQAMCKGNIKREYTKRFGRPSREVMTGSELQNATRPLLAHSLPNLQPLYFQEGSSGGFDTLPETNHSALLRIFKDICFSRTAFDRFECETLDWAHKYAPRRAEEVLQSGREALVLRDWLKSLTVTSVGSGSSELPKGQDKSIPSRRLEAYSKRKKRKRAEELDGFVISSDEEAVEMEELANPEIYENTGHAFSGKKSVVRVANISGRPAEGHRSVNAIVISGPHGCGKTAAVYAVARELDFEVFEINSGSRRSGKDIIEKVGDMTKNHLVNQACETKVDELAKGIPISTESLTPGVRSSCQSNGKPVLKPKAEVKKKPRGRPKFHAKPLENNDNLKKTKQSQKQSLILLEEVDVLFEEDRQFWATTLDLILHSKRPIIMTCSDENFLPLDEMILFAVLRFTPPPEPLAIDYLILIASSEGHLLSRKSLSTLLQYKHFDLRASITELNFFCQMAIGDTKGGLEWMMVQPSPTNKQTREDKNSRVVSVGTYGKHLSYIDRMEPNLETQLFIDKAKNYSSKIWERWNADADYSRECRLTPSMVKHSQVKQEHALQRLMAFEQVLDAISAADTHLFSEHRQSNLVGRMSPSHVLYAKTNRQY